MQDKIKQIQEYFKDKIIAWDFKYKIKDDEISILIDDKYIFIPLLDDEMFLSFKLL